jgi:predicted GIY-YIG superfamily endonuclease
MGSEIFLYVLELENFKYYVGQTNDVYARFQEHKEGYGSSWTRLHKPIKILKIRSLEVEDTREALLYENWLTLFYMQRFGFQNVRGGEFLVLEDYKLAEKLELIYDLKSNSIKDFGFITPYLFGASYSWLVYVLELRNSKYYIGSTKRLGKSVGAIFLGQGNKWIQQNAAIRIIELVVVKDGNYLDVKRFVTLKYKELYGEFNVLGSQN